MGLLTTAERTTLQLLLRSLNGDLPAIDSLFGVAGDGSGKPSTAERTAQQNLLRSLTGNAAAIDALFGVAGDGSANLSTAERSSLQTLLLSLSGDPTALDALSFGSIALREIGTRSSLNQQVAANTLAYNSRKAFFNRSGTPITQIKIAWANFAVFNGVETPTGGVLSVSGSIEYPIGVTRTQLQFGGSATGTITSGGVLACDLTTIPSLPDGAKALLRFKWSNTVGIPYSPVGPFESVALGDGNIQNATDFTMSGDFVDSNDGVQMWPQRIMGMTASTKDVLIIGDSRQVAVGETQATQDASGDGGEVARAIGGTRPYWRLGQSGLFISQLATTQHTLQDQLTALAPPSRVIIVCGINDLAPGGGSRTAAQILADGATVAARYTCPVHFGTISPRTTSTDWTTLGGQTPASGEAQRILLNNAIRANAGGYATPLEVAIESAINSGLWPVTGASGVLAYTTDGLHATALGDKSVVISLP